MMQLGHLAIVGPMGAGKSTLAEAIAQSEGHAVLPLAAPIKQVAVALLGRPLDKGNDRSLLQKLAMSARQEEWAVLDTPHIPARLIGVERLAKHLMPEAGEHERKVLYDALYEQGLSAGWGDANYWTRRWQAAFYKLSQCVVVDDLRFPAEAESLRSLGFQVIRLAAPLALRKARILHRDGRWDDAWATDPTEAWADGVVSDIELDGAWEPKALVSHLKKLILGKKASLPQASQL